MLQITLLADEWKSSKGGLSTINRELAIELAKQPNVSVTYLVPKCGEADKNAACSHNIQVVEAEERPGFPPVDWLCFPPEDLVTDVILGHGVPLGRQAQIIKKTHRCAWIQVVHTTPEELAMHKTYPDAISKGDEKQCTELKLCKMADFVVTIGPKLFEFYSVHLRQCGKTVFNLTPGIFTELSDLALSTEEAKKFRVLLFGRGDSEDFQLKGLDIAAKAVAELNDRSYELKFVGAPRGKEEVVRTGILEQGLNRSRSQLTVKGFIENREELARLLSTANLVVIPSRTEGFGLTALEALSAGLPFLVSHNSGFAEALEEIPTGISWIIDSEDPDEWAKAIKGVREKGSKTARNECQEVRTLYAKTYSWEEQCRVLVKTIQPLVNADRKLQEECFSSENLNNGRDPSTQRHDFPKAGGDITGDKQEPCNEPGKDEKSLISQEPSRKKSKERMTPAGKGFLNSLFKITRRKKSPDPSSNEESSVAFESTSKSSLETSATTSGNYASFYSGAAPQSCEIVSPVTITQARRLPLCRSCRNSIASPISPGHESGFMSLEVDYNEEPQEKCFSSDNLNDGRDPATQRPSFLRATSWPSGRNVIGEKPNPVKDARSLINQNSKERKSIISVLKTKRRKKSSDPSGNGENYGFESSLEASMPTSRPAESSYSEAAQQCETVSVVPEAQSPPFLDSLSSGESIASSISPEYEPGFISMEDPPVSCEKTISFIHCFDSEGEAFKNEVLKLYDRFGQCLGYRCHLDKLETIQVAENKFRYVLNNVQRSNFVFICVSPELKRIFDSSHKEISRSLDDDKHCMLRLAADMILAEIAIDASNRKGKFITIMLKGSSTNDVPYYLNSYMKYHWPKDELHIRFVIEEMPEMVSACVDNVKTDPLSLL